MPIYIAVFLIIDQFTKYLASFFGLVIINSGISFGFFSGTRLDIILAICWVGFWLILGKTKAKFPLATGMVLGGAVSNIIDRFLWGGVRDFIPLPPFVIRNNLADWMIVCGLVYMLWKSREIIQAK